MFDDTYDLAEALLNNAKSWADPFDTSREENFLYVAGEPELAMYGILALEKEHDHAILDEYLDELLKLRTEDYFNPEYWEDEHLLEILPWFEQKRAEQDAN